MHQWNQFKTKRKRTKTFITSHSEIEKAVAEYLKNGGKITKLEANDANFSAFVNKPDSTVLVDQFFFED